MDMNYVKDQPFFVHIGKISHVNDWHNLHPVHPNHELAVVMSGRLHLTDDNGSSWLMEQGDAAIYPAGCRHSEYSCSSCPAEIYYTVFEADALPWQKITVHKNAGHALRPLASQLFEAFAADAEKNILDKFIALMLAVFASPPDFSHRMPRYISSAINEMRRYPGNSFTLESLAANAGMSKFHFLRSFRKYTGKTPFAMLDEIRCKEAAALLECTDLPVKIIAQRTGFTDASHMRKRLKNITGTSLAVLRAQEQNPHPGHNSDFRRPVEKY